MSSTSKNTKEIKETDTGGFEKAIKIAKTIRKLGDKNSTFPTWENEVKKLLNHYPMDEYEKIRIIMATVTDENYDLCSNTLFTNDKCTSEDLITEIKKLLGYDNTSINNLDKLVKIRVQNNNIKSYNLDFKILLNGIEKDDRPTTKRIIQYYIRGLKGTRYYHSLVLKKFSSLDDAIKEVNKMVSSYEEYEGSQNKTYHSNKTSHKTNQIQSRNRNYPSNYLSKYSSNNYKTNNLNKEPSKPKDNEKDSDVENLTEKFSKM